MRYSIVITTTGSKKSAKEITNHLLSKKLAGCIQIEKIKSHYLWKGEIHKDKEYRLTMKTQRGLVGSLERELLKIHPYDTPQFIVVDIDSGSKEYFRWIDEVLES